MRLTVSQPTKSALSSLWGRLWLSWLRMCTVGRLRQEMLTRSESEQRKLSSRRWWTLLRPLSKRLRSSEKIGLTSRSTKSCWLSSSNRSQIQSKECSIITGCRLRRYSTLRVSFRWVSARFASGRSSCSSTSRTTLTCGQICCAPLTPKVVSSSPRRNRWRISPTCSNVSASSYSRLRRTRSTSN